MDRGGREPRDQGEQVKLTARIATTFETAGARQDDNGRAAVPSVSRNAEGTGARSGPLARAAMLLASVALLFGVAAPAANAATATDSYGYLTSFGSGVAYTLFNSPYNAVAIDGGTGNIVVSEQSGDGGPRVLVYAPDPLAGGVPLTTVDTYGLGHYFPGDVAVDQADGALYVMDAAALRVHRFLSDGAPVPTYTEDLSYSMAPG